MASIRRERLFEEYSKRKFNADRNLLRTFIMTGATAGGLYIILNVYYFIRCLALLAGGNFYFAQLILNKATGSNDPLPLMYKVPYLFMFYLFLIASFSGISFAFKKKIFIWFNLIVYAVSFLYSIVSIYNSSMSITYSVLLMAYSIYGLWVSDITLRQFKELKFLSKQDGYPDFIEIMGAPEPIANTRGVYLRQYQELKDRAYSRTKEKIAVKDSDSCVDIKEYLTPGGNGTVSADSMDELTTNFSESIDDLLKKSK